MVSRLKAVVGEHIIVYLNISKISEQVYVALSCRNNKMIVSFDCDKMYVDAF